jgi:hypothetical protein
MEHFDVFVGRAYTPGVRAVRVTASKKERLITTSFMDHIVGEGLVTGHRLIAR